MLPWGEGKYGLYQFLQQLITKKMSRIAVKMDLLFPGVAVGSESGRIIINTMAVCLCHSLYCTSAPRLFPVGFHSAVWSGGGGGGSLRAFGVPLGHLDTQAALMGRGMSRRDGRDAGRGGVCDSPRAPERVAAFLRLQRAPSASKAREAFYSFRDVARGDENPPDNGADFPPSFPLAEGFFT